MTRTARALALPLLLLLLCGCARPGATLPTSPSVPGTPFHLDREGDLLNGTSGEWHWRVAPGFTAFRVHLFLTEMPGPGPALVATHDVRFRLVGEGTDGHRVGEGDNGSPLSAGNGDGCVLCEDSGFPGNWTFTLSAGPSAAHYRLHIETMY